MTIRVLALAAFLLSTSAFALQIDWSGEFHSEFNYVHNYELDSSDTGGDVTPRDGAGGYKVPAGGSKNANFTNLFMRVKPKVTVNDNVYLYSEWWLGDPIFGIFGNAVPYSTDQRQYYSTQSRGSVITAQRFWGEFDSDVGVFEVGRAPLDWGLGVVWNRGDGIWKRGSHKGDPVADRRVGYGRSWDRYASTADQIRLVSKFGSFSFSPAYILYSSGNNIGGACTFATPAACTPVPGGGGVADYSISLKYENLDEDLEGGVNFIRRIGQAAQDAYVGPGATAGTAVPVGMSYNTWDLYGKKKLGKITIAGELPIISGSLGSGSYSTWSLATEIDWKISESWDTNLRVGHVPGQPGSSTGVATDYKAYYFHPNYKLGLIMFNYQLNGFAGPNTLNKPVATASQLRSPYDNPITNANYLNFGAAYHTDKWDFHTNWVFARANEAAGAGDAFFFNQDGKTYVANGAGKGQEKNLGWEMDFGTTFQWDDNFQFGLDFGLFFPGGWWKFSNTPVDNATDTLFAAVARVGVSF